MSRTPPPEPLATSALESDAGPGSTDGARVKSDEAKATLSNETLQTPGNAGYDLVERLQPDVVIDQKYRVLEVIGKGGMGIVVSARQEDLDRDVALKFLYVPNQEQHELRLRFKREAQVNAKLRNEHITRVLDVGTWEGNAYIVMERLDGIDLRRELQRCGGTFALDDAVRYAIQICEGIAEAHAHGIVHRDLKPSNVFVTQSPDGLPLLKIMDFGISKWDAETEGLTISGTVLGSPKYMAPEQVFGADVFGSGTVDSRADIWSIGVILYEMLAGVTPYKGPNLTRFCADLMSGPPKRVSEVAPQQIPRALCDLLASCVERNPALRPQTVAHLAGALQDAIGSEGVSVRSKLDAILSMRPRTITESGPISLRLPGAGTPSTGVSRISPMSEVSATRPSKAVRWLALLGVVSTIGIAAAIRTALRNAVPSTSLHPATAEPGHAMPPAENDVAQVAQTATTSEAFPDLTAVRDAATTAPRLSADGPEAKRVRPAPSAPRPRIQPLRPLNPAQSKPSALPSSIPQKADDDIPDRRN
jgi:eukaryotic-like serine/threonine-protein kinase